MNEVWKDIPMYAGIYEVSTLGRVRSKITGRLATCRKNEKGYVIARIYLNGLCKNERVHRLVAITFLPNPNGYPQVNHIDEDKTNNCVDNLEWCTAEYNVNYGLHNYHTSVTLGTPVTIDGIYFPSISKCAKYLGLPVSTINNYLTGKNKMPPEFKQRGFNYAKR